MANNNTAETFNDGIVIIYKTENIAEDGAMPVIEKVEKGKLRFRELTVGINRFYSALENVGEVEKVIRTQRIESVLTHDIAEINDIEYEIMQIQYPTVETIKVMDLSLVRKESNV